MAISHAHSPSVDAYVDVGHFIVLVDKGTRPEREERGKKRRERDY